MKTIVTVIGARPQFIKASVVSHAIAAQGGLHEVLVHTGQHFDANMSDVFFAELGMAPPAHQLAIHGGRHGAMTGQMLAAVEQVLVDVAPDAVLVYGDTNSTLAGALAAVKLHIPVAHVEAGLRSFNMAMPEEVNRILTDRISRWLFTPTDTAREHLLREGVDAERIVPVGDVMYDVALHHGARASASGGALARLGLASGGYVLATVHRAENTDEPQRLQSIVAALQDLAATLPVVWPLHPRTRGVLQQAGWQGTAPGLKLIDPVGYLDMVQLEKHAALVATDSGGVQKEAFFHGVPCVTLRDETEWVELVDAGWNRLAPPRGAAGVAAALRAALGTRGRLVAPYGQGDAAQRIVQRLAMDLRA
ncbi:MAG: UDP-N-acetylglucosamine 2-epimerase (non-hydrolyzing) [Rubrivivax sp.]|nr:UDP-N-acetylglucosamine 2-epimerase (non-hydrolyzing) [Rubrivivax sp.]MBP6465565.1 UDP-N-acetylglucosamine 2-epimerase (non-hydrolyzing) [Rubrivivax sp.]